LQTREFFAAFFTLSDFHWHGFLSTRLSFPELIGFGVALFFNASNSARGNLLMQGVPGELTTHHTLKHTTRMFHPHVHASLEKQRSEDADLMLHAP
jgi:hypothetical protein